MPASSRMAHPRALSRPGPPRRQAARLRLHRVRAQERHEAGIQGAPARPCLVVLLPPVALFAGVLLAACLRLGVGGGLAAWRKHAQPNRRGPQAPPPPTATPLPTTHSLPGGGRAQDRGQAGAGGRRARPHRARLVRGCCCCVVVGPGQSWLLLLLLLLLGPGGCGARCARLVRSRGAGVLCPTPAGLPACPECWMRRGRRAPPCACQRAALPRRRPRSRRSAHLLPAPRPLRAAQEAAAAGRRQGRRGARGAAPAQAHQEAVCGAAHGAGGGGKVSLRACRMGGTCAC